MLPSLRLRPLVLIALLGSACALARAEDATLTNIVRQALIHSPEVRSARALWEATDAQTRQVRSRWWPSVGVNAQAGQADVTDLGQEISRRTERAEAYMRVNVYNGGADQALLKATEHDKQAARLDLTRTLQDVAEKAAQAFFEVQHQQALLQEMAARLEDVRQLTEDVNRLVTHGKSAESDSHLAQASLADAQGAYESAVIDASLAHRRLQILTGRPVGELQAFDLPTIEIAAALDTPASAIQAANPAWLAAQERATSARVKLGPIQPELLPKVDLEWRKLLSERTRPTPSTGQQQGWSVNVAYDMPLGGASFARRDEGLARAAAADGETGRIGQTIELDLDDALQNLHRAQQTTPLYQRQARHLDAVVSAGTLQYAAGRRDLVDLISLRDAPHAVKQKLADNEFKRQTAALRYWSLSGQLLPVLGLSALLP